MNAKKPNKDRERTARAKGPNLWQVVLVTTIVLAGWWALNTFQTGMNRRRALPETSTETLPLSGIPTTDLAAEPAPREPTASDRTPVGSSRPASGGGKGVPSTGSVLGRETARSYLDYLNGGNEELAQGNLESALAHYLQALEMEKEDEDVYFNLGVVMGRLNKREESIAYYTKALEIFPDYAEAHNNLGNQYLKEGRLKEAEEAFKEALVSYPDYAIAENNLGNALGRQGKTEEALAHFKRATELDASYTEAKYNYGNALAFLRRYDEARLQFESILSENPEFNPAERAIEALNRVRPNSAP